MAETKTRSGSGLVLLILSMILGYFVYGNVAGALGIGLLYIIVGFFIIILSVIPVIGLLISAIISYIFIIPMILNFTGLYWTWLVTIIFGLHLIIGLCITIAVLVIIISAVFK